MSIKNLELAFRLQKWYSANERVLMGSNNARNTGTGSIRERNGRESTNKVGPANVLVKK